MFFHYAPSFLGAVQKIVPYLIQDAQVQGTQEPYREAHMNIKNKRDGSIYFSFSIK